MRLTLFDCLLIGQGKPIVAQREKSRGVRPVLKHRPLPQQPFCHQRLKTGNARIQYVMVSSLHDRNTVDLQVAKMRNGVFSSQKPCAEGPCLKETLRRQGEASKSGDATWASKFSH